MRITAALLIILGVAARYISYERSHRYTIPVNEFLAQQAMIKVGMDVPEVLALPIVSDTRTSSPERITYRLIPAAAQSPFGLPALKYAIIARLGTDGKVTTIETADL